MPVATHVGCFHRDDDHVSKSWWDLLVAAWAQVGLGCLVWMDETLLQVAQDLGVVHFRRSPRVAERSQEECPGDKDYGHHDGRAHVEDIAGSPALGALRIEPHTVSIVGVRCDPTVHCY